MSTHDTQQPDLELVRLRDAVRVAERAIGYHDQMLRKRVAEVQALDGVLLTAWTTLLGSREQRIEEGVAQVEAARRALETSKGTLAAARAALADAEGEREQAAEHEAERRAELEARASAIRGTTHPDAAALDALEAEIIALGSSLVALDETIAAGASLVSMASSIMTRARAGSYRGTTGGPRLNRAPNQQQFRMAREINATMGPWREKAARFERAVAGLGLDWQVGGKDTAAPGMTSWLGSGVDHEYLYSGAMSDIADRFEMQREEIRMILDRFGEERSALVERQRRLDTQREQLLAG